MKKKSDDVQKKKEQKKLRVLAVASTYYPHMGGAERAMHELYTRLPEYEFIVDLVTPYCGGKTSEEVIKGFHVFRVDKKRDTMVGKFLLNQWAEYKKMLALAKKNRYDLVHCHYLVPCAGAALLIAKQQKIPFVISEYHLGTGRDIIHPRNNPFYINPYMRFIVRHTDRILTNGITQQNFLRWLLGKVPKQNVTVQLGSPDVVEVSLEEKKQLRKKYGYEDKLIVFSMGRLNKRKNFKDLILAAKKVAKKYTDVLFLIAGTGEEQDALASLIKQENMEGYVLLLGSVSDQKREELYKLSDVFAFAALYEGSGIVYTEAMSYSIPVVAYENEAVKSIIRSDNYGILTKQSPEQLAKGILKLLSDPQRRSEIVKQGHTLIRTVHNWGQYAKTHATLFKEIVQGHHHGHK